MATKIGIPLSFNDVINLHNEFLSLADELNFIRERRQFTIETKSDGSPVTSADFKAHKFLSSYFEEKLPQFSIISEEMESPELSTPTEYTLFMDPIDGTKHFIEGNNPYFSLIGLTHKGVAIQGFHFRMDNGDLLFNVANEVYIRSKNGITNPLVIDEPRDLLLSMKMVDNDLRQKLGELGYQREKYQYLHLEMVHPLFSKSAGMLSKRRTWFWDICAPAAIMNAAGLSMSMFDSNNNPINFSKKPIYADWWHCLHPDHSTINSQLL